VFRSTFSLDAARAVAPEVDPIPALARLVRRSLVRRHPDGRFSVAALVRVGAGEPTPEVARALAGWLAGEHRRIVAAHAPFSDLRPHRADLVALLGRLDLDGADVARLGGLLSSLLLRYGPLAEVGALEGAFARAEGPVRASLAMRLAGVARVRGDWAGAERWAAAGLEAGPGLHVRIQLLHSLAASARELGDLPLARIRAREALELAESTGDADAIGFALEAMGGAVAGEDPAAALPLFDRQVALAERVSNPDHAIVGEVNGAWCAVALGRWDDARVRVESAIARRSDSARLQAITRGLRGLLLAILGRDDEARADLDQALALSAPFPGDELPGAHLGLALLARRAGDDEAVRRHLAQADEVPPSVAALLDR
jgi:tetratricopeptide (TPR) repeat protein